LRVGFAGTTFFPADYGPPVGPTFTPNEAAGHSLSHPERGRRPLHLSSRTRPQATPSVIPNELSSRTRPQAEEGSGWGTGGGWGPVPGSRSPVPGIFEAVVHDELSSPRSMKRTSVSEGSGWVGSEREGRSCAVGRGEVHLPEALTWPEPGLTFRFAASLPV